ncbi:hypothetical protein CBR64_20540 [Cellulosimicrobium cellulans]|uniref:Uncharacterized protein n=1 Tax=Cellulosimicrobium cellulans TaxID=1710 RepID=A0A1Y0I239_CELCE|nr:hypothetical protein CBR64_20540 [Cellulosimicrobium cellulans]
MRGKVVEDDVRRDALDKLSLALQGEAGRVVNHRSGPGDEITDQRPLAEAPFGEGSSRCTAVTRELGRTCLSEMHDSR